MTELTRHSTAVPSVYTLIGTLENDLTAALGYTLTRSPTLRAGILRRVWPTTTPPPTDDATLALEVRDTEGRTDLEMRFPGALVIFEAKRGWLVPTAAQLAKYAGRIAEHPHGGLLVTLSQASTDLATAAGLPASIDGIPVVHLPWTAALNDITTARRMCRGTERVWLDELHAYLKEVIRMRKPEDCRTYCVVLNQAKPGDGESAHSSSTSPTSTATSTPTAPATDGPPSPQLHGVPMGWARAKHPPRHPRRGNSLTAAPLSGCTGHRGDHHPARAVHPRSPHPSVRSDPHRQELPRRTPVGTARPAADRAYPRRRDRGDPPAAGLSGYARCITT